MPRILIVEDNEDNRAVYAAILAHAGHQVLEATNGAEGVAMARRERPDLVVMDLSMPVLDGLAATRILKAEDATRGIPVLMLTAHVFASDRDDAVAAGADHFLTKPLDPKALLAEVEAKLVAGG